MYQSTNQTVMNYQQFQIRGIRQSSDSKKTVVVINDDSIDTYGTLIDPAGADLSQYQRNPVFLINHDRNMVAGNGASVRYQDNKLIAEVPDEAWDQDDDVIKRWMGKVKRGIVKMASIGAMWDENDVEMRQTDEGKEYAFIKRWTLLEFSFLPLGGNYNAMVMQRDLNMPDYTTELTNIRGTLARIERQVVELTATEPETPEPVEPEERQEPEQPSVDAPALTPEDVARIVNRTINRLQGKE